MDTLKYFICLCLIIAAAVQANPATTPSIEVSAEQLKIATGESASVTCTPGGNPRPSVKWRKHEGEIGAGTKISGDTLLIGDAQDSDRGYYVCVGVVGATVVAQKFVYVDIENVDPSVQGNPKVTVSQRTISIPRGGRGAVECKPEGNPLPRVQWIKSDGELRSGISPSGNTLIISDAREEDYGDYVCQGIVDGTVMVTDYLRVNIENVDPSVQGNPKVTVSQRTISIPRGGRGAVECKPEGNPLPRVQWIKSDGELRSGISPKGNTLKISDAREEDYGDYVCQGIVEGTVMVTDYLRVNIENAVPPPRENLKLTVSHRTLNIPKGGSGSIECTPEGNPLPKVHWIKANGEFRDGISQSGNTLIISDARMEDRGHYACQGIVGGTVMLTNYSAVDVQDVDPSTQSDPTVTVTQRTISIPRGGRGTVECKPEGNPLPRVQWIKSDGELRSEISPSGNTLIISDAREEDYGDYVCQGIVDGTVMVTDYLRVVIENVDPSVQGNPKVTVSQRTISIPRGGRGTVECKPEGNPLPRVQWIKSDGELRSGISPKGNTLIISDAREEDYGDYVCQGIVEGTVMVTDYLRVNIENAVPPPRETLKLTVSHRTLNIPKGGSGSIECTPEGNPLPKVQWIKANGEFRDGISQSGNTLIISDARMEDRGHYACQGIVGGTVMLTNYSAVDVQDVNPSTHGNPKVTVSQRTISIPRGGRGAVECKPEGNPLPTVQWIKSNGELRSGISTNGNTLIISDAREEDYGNYVCQGIVDGTVMVTDYLQVKIESVDPSAQSNLKVTVSQRTLLIPLGGRGTIECTPEGNPRLRVQWIKSDGQLRDGISQSGNTLIISDARMEDRGHYVCQGIVDETVMLTNYSAVEIERRSPPPVTPQTPQSLGNPKVTVSERQTRIPLGGSASIECTPEGNPLPRVRWIKSSGEFRNGIGQSENTLIISDARMEDRGHYACQGIVDGTVMVTDYSAVDIENNEGRHVHSDELPKPIDVVISEGSDASIICDFETGDLEQQVTWTRRDLLRLPQNAQIGQELVIQSATKEDSGEYLCKVTASRGGFLLRVAYIRLEVVVLPLVSVRPPAQTVARGGAVTVECVVDGDAQVTWDRVDGSLSSRVENQGSKLYIKGIEVEDAGYYRCHARNGAGISSGIAQVIVNDVERPAQLPGYVKLIVSQRQVIIPKGGSGSIECTPEGNPLPRVQWIKSNGELRDGIRQTGNTLIITDARMEDRGHYACQGIVDGTVMLTNYSAVDIRDEPQPTPAANRRSPTVVVSQKRLTITPGESVSIDCIPEGSPLPKVQWIKSNGGFRDGVRQNENALIISDAREEDEAHYVCQGVVDGTVMVTDFSAIHIENEPQTAPPAYLRSPTVVVSQKQLTITPGESVSIDCTPEGSPLPKVKWIKSNGEFRHGVRQNGNTLIISDAREEDEAHYVCQGVVDGTVMVTDYSAIHIESDERPRVVAGNSRVQVNVRQVKIPKGGSRTVDCTPEGNPLPTIQWSKHEGEFGVGTRQSDNSLIISDAQEQDGGYYVCDGMVDGTAAWTDYLSVEIESNETSQSISYPRVIVNVRQLKIPRGGTMAIECTPEGSPLPTIQWNKEGGNFGVGTRQTGNSLVISDAQEEDRGNYVCSAVVDGSPVFSDYLTVDIQYICEQPQDTGSCRAAFDRWYYDSSQQKCQKFVWGGCGGNKNNFETEEQCSLECEGFGRTLRI